MLVSRSVNQPADATCIPSWAASLGASRARRDLEGQRLICNRFLNQSTEVAQPVMPPCDRDL